MKVKIKNLQPGDVVQTELGEKVIEKISNGLYYGSKLLDFVGGDWSCEIGSAEIEVERNL